LDEVACFLFLEVFFAHEVHELADELGHHQVEGGVDERDDYAYPQIAHKSEQQVLEEAVLFVVVEEPFDAFEDGETHFAEVAL